MVDTRVNGTGVSEAEVSTGNSPTSSWRSPGKNASNLRGRGEAHRPAALPLVAGHEQPGTPRAKCGALARGASAKPSATPRATEGDAQTAPRPVREGPTPSPTPAPADPSASPAPRRSAAAAKGAPVSNRPFEWSKNPGPGG